MKFQHPHVAKCPHLVDLVGSKTQHAGLQSPYVVLMNLYTRLWLSHHMSKLKWEFAFEGWTFKNESAYRSANRLPGRCWQVLKLGTWLRIKLMRSTQIGKSLQKPLGCHQIVPSSDPSSLAGSTHSDVSPWSLHQKKHYSNPNCQET